jgi:hypothetical protein
LTAYLLNRKNETKINKETSFKVPSNTFIHCPTNGQESSLNRFCYLSLGFFKSNSKSTPTLSTSPTQNGLSNAAPQGQSHIPTNPTDNTPPSSSSTMSNNGGSSGSGIGNNGGSSK